VEGALEQVLEGGVGVEGALVMAVVAVGDGFGVGGGGYVRVERRFFVRGLCVRRARGAGGCGRVRVVWCGGVWCG